MDTQNNIPIPAATPAIVVENHARGTVFAGIPHAFLPPDYKLQDLERTLEVPSRRRGNFAVLTADGFNRQVVLLRRAVAFAGSERKAAVADYDPLPIYFLREGNAAQIQAVLNPGCWRDLTVTLAQKLSDPFVEWLELNKQGQPQRKFADFLEQRTHHVIKPEGAKLLELCRKFKATTNVRFQSLVEDANGNGDGSLEFIQTTQAGTADAKGSMKVPDRITLGLPVWHGGDHVKIDARFGYSISEGRLSLSFEILRLNELLSETLRTLVEKIGKEHPNAVLIEGENASIPALGQRG